jgi:hypothetical protein
MKECGFVRKGNRRAKNGKDVPFYEVHSGTAEEVAKDLELRIIGPFENSCDVCAILCVVEGIWFECVRAFKGK